ncbi:NADH dehydrogenase (ubiquinone) MNLL subunit [Aphomia sociella]
MAIFGITTRYVWVAVPFTGYFIGKFLDDQETLRMTSFRDKSCLYGGRVKEGDPPSWP